MRSQERPGAQRDSLGIRSREGTGILSPLPHPGDGPAPKPLTLPAGKLHDALGIREVAYTKGQRALALKERTLP